ncbi:MAG: hypothetical protein R3B90_07535 [Planctomycetaceae bacterium]
MLLVDWPTIESDGVAVQETEVTLPAGVPLYLALNTLESHLLDWTVDRGVLRLTTSDHASGQLVRRRYDVGSLIEQRDISIEALVDLIQNATCEESSSPWLNVHGVGGAVSSIESTLAVLQTERGQREVAALLAALQSPGPQVYVGLPQEDLRLQRALTDRIVSVDFQDATLQEVIDTLAQETGLPMRADESRLAEYGIGLDHGRISLSLADQPLPLVLDLLLEPLEIAAVARNGAIEITSRDFASTLLRTVVFDVSDITATIAQKHQLLDAIQSQTGDEEYGPWFAIHGDGGVIGSPTKGLLIVRQTDTVIAQIDELLADVRRSLIASPRAEPRVPNQMETRFYRLPRQTAEDLLVALPRLVSAGDWNGPIDALIDPSKGTIQIIETGNLWSTMFPAFGGGGFGGGAGGMGGGMGGGLFQFGGGGLGGGAGTANQLGDTGGGMVGGFPPSPPNFDAVLIIRHRVAVHEQIERLLNKLLFDNPEGSDAYGGVPNAVLPQ